MSWCLMSSDVIWHIRDKLWPMPKHGSIKATYVRCMRVLAVTCHLHFWQNDRDFLRATVVTRGWNGYRNKSQHRKSTLEKKILPPFQQGFEPATFQSRVRRSNHWAIPAPVRCEKLFCAFISVFLAKSGLYLVRLWSLTSARNKKSRKASQQSSTSAWLIWPHETLLRFMSAGSSTVPLQSQTTNLRKTLKLS